MFFDKNGNPYVQYTPTTIADYVTAKGELLEDPVMLAIAIDIKPIVECLLHSISSFTEIQCNEYQLLELVLSRYPDLSIPDIYSPTDPDYGAFTSLYKHTAVEIATKLTHLGVYTTPISFRIAYNTCIIQVPALASKLST